MFNSPITAALKVGLEYIKGILEWDPIHTKLARVSSFIR